MEILLPVSMVIWQGCSSTLPATNRFSDPCNTPVLKFSVGACVKVAELCPTSSATDSFSDPTQGWQQQQGVYFQWIVSCNFAVCGQFHCNSNKYAASAKIFGVSVAPLDPCDFPYSVANTCCIVFMHRCNSSRTSVCIPVGLDFLCSLVGVVSCSQSSCAAQTVLAHCLLAN